MLFSIILAAGQGKRMKSDLPKVLHKACGKEMLIHVMDVAKEAGVTKQCVVVGHKKELVMDAISSTNAFVAVQEEQNGTGHAVQVTKPVLEEHFSKDDSVLILCGDTPCLKSENLNKFVDGYKKSTDAIHVLSTRPEDPAGYGRIVRDENGGFLEIREDKDCDENQKAIDEINTGIYVGKLGVFYDLLESVDNNNSQGEFYLTDVIELARERGLGVEAVCLGTEDEFLGVNSPGQLQRAEEIISSRR
jgi:bifunctional UDP-N-acetylglucosamine pyrophosphorylase/glucosamine-1-phosphate N-acetyltransferase